MVKKSNIRFAQLRAFFEGMGFSATREKKGWRVEHPATGTVFIFRPYRSNELVYAPDLFLIRSQLNARGMVAEDEFEESLTKTPVQARPRAIRRRSSVGPKSFWEQNRE